MSIQINIYHNGDYVIQTLAQSVKVHSIFHLNELFDIKYKEYFHVTYITMINVIIIIIIISLHTYKCSIFSRQISTSCYNTHLQINRQI